jgi:hypothetical protein
MLLNEFLKEHQRAVQEHRKVEEQQTKLEQQQGTIAAIKSAVAKQQDFFAAKIAHQQLQIEALTATVQKMSNQIALDKPAPQ